MKLKLSKNQRKIIRRLFSFKQRVKIYWRLECLKLALSSKYNNVRDKNSEDTANKFFDYITKTSEEEKLKKLKDGLDENSKQEIDNFLIRQKYIYKHNIFDQKKLFTPEEIDEQELSNKESIKIQKEINKFIFDHYTIESFYGISGLRWLPKDKKENIKNGIFFDVGAFDGDSAISFYNNFQAEKIYCFEPEEKNFNRLKQNSKVLKNNIIEPIKKGVSKQKGEATISSRGSMSKLNHNKGEKICITSIDDFVKEKNINKVSVIKMDIEGEEMNAIVGATETIKKYKPILSISIYHTPVDFFEIKPYLKELVPEYKFIIKKANPFSLNHELMLLAY